MFTIRFPNYIVLDTRIPAFSTLPVNYPLPVNKLPTLPAFNTLPVNYPLLVKNLHIPVCF